MSPQIQHNIKIVSLTGSEIHKVIPQIAALRIEVFHEYPYLYAGSLEYEEHYLEKFYTMEDALVIAAYEQDEIVGISTAFPFIYEDKELTVPFIKAGRDPSDYYWFAESVLRKSYRGQGIGNAFFLHREQYAKELNKYKYITLCCVARAHDDPRRPKEYHPLGPFWQKHGFKEHPELVGAINYPEIGETQSTSKKMIFWIKEL